MSLCQAIHIQFGQFDQAIHLFRAKRDHLPPARNLDSTISTQKSANLSPWQWSVLTLIVVCAVAIRVYDIGNEPFDFHPVKQYRSAMTARALYYMSTAEGSIPNWKRDVADANLRDIGILQPPVISGIAAFIYRLIGVEALWIPKLFSAMMWLSGSLFLYLLARRIMQIDAALFAVAFYLLVPFAARASQSFQIDPLMVALTVAGLYLLERYTRSGSISLLLVAALVSSLAILLKPISLFIIFAAFVGLRISGPNPRRILNWHTLLFESVCLLPTSIYYGYEIFFVKGVLHEQAAKSFVPVYFAEFRFWDGWQKRIGQAVGFTYMFGGLAGALTYQGRPKTFIVALWVGYVFMCLAFNYPISTHDYYHLLLIPIVALSIGPLAKIIWSKMQPPGAQQIWHYAARGVVISAILFAAATSIQEHRKIQRSNSQINIAREIGVTIAHSTQTIYLAPEQGYALMYYGEFSGLYWPYRYDIRDEALWLGHTISTPERFRTLDIAVDADYFIVVDREEFAAQSDLQQYVVNNYPIFKETDDYLIYALKQNN